MSSWVREILSFAYILWDLCVPKKLCVRFGRRSEKEFQVRKTYQKRYSSMKGDEQMKYERRMKSLVESNRKTFAWRKVCKYKKKHSIFLLICVHFSPRCFKMEFCLQLMLNHFWKKNIFHLWQSVYTRMAIRYQNV